MKMVRLFMLVVGFGLSGAAAFGSGFVCTEDGSDGLNVKLYNNIMPSEGTRTPAVLVISSPEHGTLLRRFGSEISKVNRRDTVQYVVKGNERLDAEMVILQVRFKEGREVISEGDTVPGQMILIAEDATRSVHSLTCERYLK